MLKMGTYGFLRWVIPLFPDASEYFAWLFMLVGAIGIIYGALVAMVQPDIKKLVAYSSVSHMGYVLIGLFAFNEFGMTGSLYQMLNHGQNKS
jgi:NADH-quinone oxidoreductase subunit M